MTYNFLSSTAAATLLLGHQLEQNAMKRGVFSDVMSAADDIRGG